LRPFCEETGDPPVVFEDEDAHFRRSWRPLAGPFASRLRLPDGRFVPTSATHVSELAGDRRAVDVRQEAAMDGRRSQNSEHVRALATEPRFRAKPDS
jgi:hypothetical protein